MSGGQNHWERQKREIDAYNVFYSSFQGVEGGPDLTDLGFVSPARFPEIPIRGRQNDAEPDFVSFNGSTLLLPEIKSGSNLSERVERQMERCAEVTIEDGQEYLRNSDYFSNFGFEHTDLAGIEPCIVFTKEKYDSQIRTHNGDLLDRIEEHCPILTQFRGGELSIERGQFGEAGLNSFLQSGISLPAIPPTAVFLNEEVEKESLAVSICYDIVMPDLKNGEVVLSTTDVDNIYPGRAISIDDVFDVFHFLADVGICEEIDRGEYRFDQESQREIFQVIDVVSEQRVDEYLHDIDEEQSDVRDFD